VRTYPTSLYYFLLGVITNMKLMKKSYSSVKLAQLPIYSGICPVKSLSDAHLNKNEE